MNSGDFPPTLILGQRPPKTPDKTPRQVPHLPAEERFSFTGTGSEYFRIWIVNLLLTIITLGIYSAWAKVRRLRYFYNSTHVAGSTFEYHGQPKAILKGRIIAVLLIIAYQYAPKIAPRVGYLTMLLFIAVMPWLIWKSLQFKLHNSSYRGIRFGFAGSLARAYKVFLLYPFISSITAGLLAPFAHQRIKQYQHGESRFGASGFSFQGRVGQFYAAYLMAIVIFAVGLVWMMPLFKLVSSLILQSGQKKGAAAVLSGIIFLFAILAWGNLAYHTFMTMLQNLIWNNTMLEDHGFRSEMKWTRVVFIAVTNLIGIALTLGLFTPFAKIRMLKYRIESMTLVPAGSLEHFMADRQPETSATGEAMTDLLDFDFAL